MQIHTLTTDECQPGRRLDHWNAVTSAALIKQIAEPADPKTFRGRLRSANLGRTRLVELSASASTVVHTRSHIAQSSESPFLPRLPLMGHVSVLQDSAESRLGAGDYALCDSSRPYTLNISEHCVVFTLCIPRETIALQMIAASYAGFARADVTRSSISVDDSIARYVLRRRLEECALALRDPRLAARSIVDIAFGNGFNSAAHFARVFRDRYQTTPRDYRRERIASAARTACHEEHHVSIQ